VEHTTAMAKSGKMAGKMLQQRQSFYHESRMDLGNGSIAYVLWFSNEFYNGIMEMVI
jgi:hypothetical protein